MDVIMTYNNTDSSFNVEYAADSWNWVLTLDNNKVTLDPPCMWSNSFIIIKGKKRFHLLDIVTIMSYGEQNYLKLLQPKH